MSFKIQKSSILIFLILIILTSFSFAEEIKDDFFASKVKDISDRRYEEAVIGLLDNAKSSIVISMYSISLTENSKNPVALLINDLLEARKRGVTVAMYLNTRFGDDSKREEIFSENSIFNKLKDAGCEIHLIPYSRRLHDKLIIVDNQFVVEGSTNWSIAALRSNFESATLIDSPDLASVKLKRLEDILISSKPKDKVIHRPSYVENLPESLTIPKALLLDKVYFPAMLTNSDNYSMKLYVLLLAYSERMGKREFFISLEDMALSLELPESLSTDLLRRQVMRCLKKLQNSYQLINVKFFHSKDAAVALIDIPGESFTIPVESIIQKDDVNLTMRLKYLLLIEALLKSEEKGLSSMSRYEIAERFGIRKTTLRSAFNDLKEYSKN